MISKKDFESFTNNLDDLLNMNPEIIRHFINTTLNYKKSLIEIDEFDTGKRNILNYGHTFAHCHKHIFSGVAQPCAECREVI